MTILSDIRKQLRACLCGLCLLLTLFLPGCSQSYPGAGTYLCTEVETGGLVLDPKEHYGEVPVLSLVSDGSGKLQIGEEGGSISWRRIGTEFRLRFDGQEFSGKMEDGTIRLEVFDSGLMLCFQLQAEGEVPALAEEEALGTGNWAQDWYGWWKICDASGTWRPYDNMWFDCFFHIDLGQDGKGSLLFWDEDSSPEEPIGRMDVQLDEKYRLHASHGNLLNLPIEPADWILDPQSGPYPQFLELEIPYVEEEGSFCMLLCLRPWGTLWDDVAQQEPELLPYYYEDWYLPLVQAGDAMPTHIEVPEATE